MRFLKSLALSAATMAISSLALAGPVIDEFTVNQASIEDDTASNGSGFWSEVVNGGGTIIGGARDLFVERRGGGASEGAAGVSMLVDAGALSYATDPRSYGLGYVRWDGDTGAAGSNAAAAISEANFVLQLNPTGLGGINLDAVASAFELTVLESDLGFKFGLQVFTDADEWTLLLLEANQHLDTDPPAVSLIDFADFAGVANENGTVLPSGALRFTGTGGSADLSSVGALQALINPNAVSQLRIDLTVDAARLPEPSGLALAGLALFAAGVAARRRRT